MSLRNDWFICPYPQPAAPLRLFCFPHAGVGTSAFRNWTTALGPDIEVVLVQLPGREGRHGQPLFSSIADLVLPLVENMFPRLDRPFAFYGHSMGGTIAFEAAQKIRKNYGSQPVHLFAGASPAPQLPWAHSPLRMLPEAEFLNEVQSRYGGLPQQVLGDPELREVFLPVLRADIAMVETYRSTDAHPLDCGITVFGGLEDAMVTRTALELWRCQTASNFRLHMIAGPHLFLRSASAQLLEIVGNELKAVSENRAAIGQNS
jgi:medium-chain acyl-[acyl-carrier-protein] hydrolase